MIDESWVCDDYPDCPNESDEAECGHFVCDGVVGPFTYSHLEGTFVTTCYPS